MIQTLTRFRNWLYDQGHLKSVEVRCPVVSVGNLRMGGVGKTPFLELLLREIYRRRLGVRIALVSRNYKAKVRKASRVDLSHTDAGTFFGDEPVMLQKKFPQLVAFVGPKKSETAQIADHTVEPSLIFVDDGFQHRALQRNLDIVLLDPDDLNQRGVPFGPLREKTEALQRADWVVFNPVGVGSSVQDWKKKLPKDVRESLNVAGVRGSLSLSGVPENSVAAFAGIARSWRFKEALETHLGKPLDNFWAFSDHQNYDGDVLKTLENWMKENPKGTLITTEKDGVKLSQWMQRFPQVKVASWTLEFEFGGELIDELDRLLESHHR